MKADVRVVNELLITKMSTPSQILVHEPSTRWDICHEFVLFERFHDGGGHAEVDDMGLEVTPSRLHMIDMSRRYVSRKRPSRSEGVLIPHAMLGYDPSVDPAAATINVASARGRFLASAHALLASGLDDADVDETGDVVSTFVSMVERFMLGSKGDDARDGADRALLYALRAHNAANLADPMLTADALCTAFGVSRATLYRRFDEGGGVARYLRNSRLDRCLFDLAGCAHERGRIAQVARRWGFHDPSTFNRLFKERFGVPPSDCSSSDFAPAEAATSRPVVVVQT